MLVLLCVVGIVGVVAYTYANDRFGGEVDAAGGGGDGDDVVVGGYVAGCCSDVGCFGGVGFDVGVCECVVGVCRVAGDCIYWYWYV